MNKFVEAIRRLLLIITWLPTTVFVCYALLNFESVTSSMDETIPILAGFIIVPLVVHYVINWIFQVNESGNNRKQQRVSESSDDNGSAYNDPVDKIFVLILAWGWFASCVYYGHTSNNIPPFDYSAPIEAAIFRLKATWIYILVGGMGMYLIQYVAAKIYKKR